MKQLILVGAALVFLSETICVCIHCRSAPSGIILDTSPPPEKKLAAEPQNLSSLSTFRRCYNELQWMLQCQFFLINGFSYQ